MLSEHSPESTERTSEYEDELFLAFREQGDERALAALIDRINPALRGLFRRHTKDEALIDDVLQETWIKVVTKAHLFQDGRSFYSWIATVAVHAMLDEKRRPRWRPFVSLDTGHSAFDGASADMIPDTAEDAAGRLDKIEMQSDIRQKLALLTEDRRRMIHAVYFDGMKYREMADLLDIPLGTVKSRLHQSMNDLKKLYVDAA